VVFGDFSILNELNANSIPESADTDARSEDDFVNEWDSDGKSFTLADELSADS